MCVCVGVVWVCGCVLCVYGVCVGVWVCGVWVFVCGCVCVCVCASVLLIPLLFLSSEDIGTKAHVNSWLKAHTRNGDIQPQLEGWIEDFFYRSLTLAASLGHTVQTTVTGLMVNGLTHVMGATTKEDFACRLVRGLGGNMTQNKKLDLSKQVFHWMNTVLPDARKPLATYFNSSGCLATYQFDVSTHTPYLLHTHMGYVLPCSTVLQT